MRSASLAVVLAATFFFAGDTKTVPPAPPGDKPPSYVNESHFIASETVSALATLARLGGGRAGQASLVPKPSPGGQADPIFGTPAPEYDVFLPGETAPTHIRFSEHIWAPGDYEVVARVLAPRLRRAPAAPGTTDRRVVERLLQPRVAVLEQLNHEISRALDVDPRDAGAHEDAALLLGVFAIRDQSPGFPGGRLALCRMTAHLALARVLRGEGGWGRTGQMADALLLGLVQRQAEAEAMMRAWPATESDAERAFRRVLDLVIVQDWRHLEEPQKKSLLERIVYARARAWKTDTNALNTFLDSYPAEDVPEWGRLAIARGFTVENCQRWVQPGFNREKAEIEEVARLSRGAPLGHGELVSALNEESRGQVFLEAGKEHVRVLDWPLWADFGRRHLLSMVSSQEICLKVFGIEDDGSLREWARTEFSQLRIFPILLVHLEKTPAEHAEAAEAFSRLCRERPDLVDILNWRSVGDPSPLGPTSIQPFDAWFSPLMPWGTLFDFTGRMWSQGRNIAVPLPALENAIRMAPYYGILRIEAGRLRFLGTPPYKEAKELYGGLVDYGTDVLRALIESAKKDAPEQTSRLAKQLCELSVGDCRRLVDLLVEQHKEEDAAEVMRHWAKDSRDRIAVANSVSWLVKYDEKHGRADEALALAQDAAATYSYNGLFALADLFETRGDLKAARPLFHQMAERYEYQGDLILFYLRHRLESGYPEAMENTMKELFPDGRVKVELASLTGEPRDGVLVPKAPRNPDTPLQMGDVIAAVNGIRVRSYRQFTALNTVECDTVSWLHLFLRRQGSYREVVVDCKTGLGGPFVNFGAW
jgi:tetratricopeptide (TPR) repeat protein